MADCFVYNQCRPQPNGSFAECHYRPLVALSFRHESRKDRLCRAYGSRAFRCYVHFQPRYTGLSNQHGRPQFLSRPTNLHCPTRYHWGSVLEHKPQPIRPQGAAWVIEQVDNNTTAINTPSVTNPERKTIYDLAGRRVQHPQKGLYIEGRKKTLHL